MSDPQHPTPGDQEALAWAEREIARYRAALQRIARGQHALADHPITAASRIAREALEAGER